MDLKIEMHFVRTTVQDYPSLVLDLCAGSYAALSGLGVFVPVIDTGLRRYSRLHPVLIYFAPIRAGLIGLSHKALTLILSGTRHGPNPMYCARQSHLMRR